MYAALVAMTLVTASPTTATETLKQRDAEVRAALPPEGGTVTPAIKKKVENILTRAIDLEAMARATLGKTWEQQPKSKQQKFLQVFKNRFRALTGDQLDSYRQADTKFDAEQVEGDETKVPTHITVKGEPVSIVYVMRKAGADWRIVDIVVDDVSTVENYRDSFGRIVAKEGFDSLIARLAKGSDKKGPSQANAAGRKP
jgi:phospholipid transport system substrate-binding protein